MWKISIHDDNEFPIAKFDSVDVGWAESQLACSFMDNLMDRGILFYYFIFPEVCLKLQSDLISTIWTIIFDNHNFEIQFARNTFDQFNTFQKPSAWSDRGLSEGSPSHYRSEE